MTTSTAIDEQSPLTGTAWRDQLEASVRGHVRGFIEELVEAELRAFLGRGRYVRKPASSEARTAAAEEQEGLGMKSQRQHLCPHLLTPSAATATATASARSWARSAS